MNTVVKRYTAATNTHRVARLALGVALIIPGFAAFAQNKCQLQLSQPTIDYGPYSRETQSPAQQHSHFISLGKRTLHLNVTCATNSLIGLEFKGQPDHENGYRFAANGLFILRIIEAQLDGKNVNLEVLNTPDNAGTARLFRPSQELVPYSGTSIATGEHLSVHIEVETFIDRAGTQVNTEASWEGAGEFAIRTITP